MLKSIFRLHLEKRLFKKFMHAKKIKIKYWKNIEKSEKKIYGFFIIQNFYVYL